MKRSDGWMIVAAVSLALAGTVFAAAMKVGTPVYVKARNTRLLAAGDVGAQVSATLQPGEVVEWQKKEGAQFHEVLVTATKKKGFVFFSNLSTQKPAPEYLRGKGDGPVDTRSFASSGAATKALAEGPIAYGEKKLNAKDAVTSVIGLDNLARGITAQELQFYAETHELNAPVMIKAGPEGAK